MKVLLSIVIANYNYGRFLEDAIKSVLYNCTNLKGNRLEIGGHWIELIICDGGSTDNSYSIITKYRDYLAWYCSERDGGQSNAFNKGFSHATGKYLTWLNADDLYVPNALPKVIAALTNHPDCSWFTSNCFSFLEDGRVWRCKWGPNWMPKYIQKKDSPMVFFGPSTFFTKKIYEQVGKIDESLHYAMDVDLWLRFVVSGVKQRRINIWCWAFRMHELSKTAEMKDHKLDESNKLKLEAEKRYYINKSKYKMSRWNRYFGLVLRFCDGSLMMSMLFKVFFKRSNIYNYFSNWRS